jgi:hypothetical protein
MVACKPVWQNMQAYQTMTNNPRPHINAEPMLVCTQYSFSCNSQIECLLTHVDMDTCTCFGSGTSAQSLSAPFSYILYNHMKKDASQEKHSYPTPTFRGNHSIFRANLRLVAASQMIPYKGRVCCFRSSNRQVIYSYT